MGLRGDGAAALLFDGEHGGIIVIAWLRDRRRERSGDRLMSVLLLAPFLLGPVEAQWQPPAIDHTVEAAVVVDAPAQTVWDSFVAVPAIQSARNGALPGFGR